MRPILFTITMLGFVASALATGTAPNTVECKPNSTQVGGHQVHISCQKNFSQEEWTKKIKWNALTYVENDAENGTVWDRADGPAYIRRDAKTGIVTYEAWFKDGKLNRDKDPAKINRDAKTGKVTQEEWYKDGLLDRAGGPAIIFQDTSTDIVTKEVWYKEGNMDRADGPAFIVRDAKTGKVIREEWWRDDKRERAR